MEIFERMNAVLENLDIPKNEILAIEAAIRGFCTKMEILKKTEDLPNLFEYGSLRNFSMIVEHLPDIIDLLFENVMSEEVDSYILMSKPQQVMREMTMQLCSGNSSVFITTAAGQKALTLLCQMDWRQFVTDFSTELIRPNLQESPNIPDTMRAAQCIYHSIVTTNWTNIVNVTRFASIGEPDLNNL